MSREIVYLAVTAATLAIFSPLSLAGDFTLSSSAVTDGHVLPEAQVFNGFGCKGGNVSPELTWSPPPAGTKSLAVTLFDPDAPTGSGWWHWVVFDIPASVTHLPAGAGGGRGLPQGAIQSRTDFGTEVYGGACPPPGAPHHYIFTVHALKVAKLNLGKDASGAMVGFTTRQNSLGKASITATYGR